MANEHETVVRDWKIPIPPELDKTCGINAHREGDNYVMDFTGTGQDLCVMAVQMLRIAGARNVTVTTDGAETLKVTRA